MVTVYVLYVSARVRNTFLGGKVGVKLLRLVSEWAKAQKAEEIHIHSTSGIEPKRSDKMLSRMGFTTYGGNYVARLGGLNKDLSHNKIKLPGNFEGIYGVSS